MKYAHRVDANQPAIVKALRDCGAVVMHASDSKMSGFDLLVAHRGALYVVEVKDGTKPPNKRALTKTEAQTCLELSRVGVRYHVVESVSEALRVIGAEG